MICVTHIEGRKGKEFLGYIFLTFSFSLSIQITRYDLSTKKNQILERSQGSVIMQRYKQTKIQIQIRLYCAKVLVLDVYVFQARLFLGIIRLVLRLKSIY